ncbi:MAG: DUF222 domain-containing protein [Nocardioidaceae bacterium]
MEFFDEPVDLQPWRLSDAEVVDAMDAAYEAATRAHAVALRLLVEVDRRGLAKAAGASSTQAWLQQRRRFRPQQARRDVELARLIDIRNPADPESDGRVEGAAVGAALDAGAMTVDQAGVVAIALSELPEDLAAGPRVQAEEILVAEAGRLSPADLCRAGHQVLAQVDPDAADRTLAEQLAREEREAYRLRSATRWADGHGSVHYRVRVPNAEDAHIWPVLDALARPTPSDGSGQRDERTGRQRMADAVVETFRRVSLDGGLPTNGGDRPRATITMELETLRSGLGAASNVDTGDLLSADAARRLACDAQVIPVVLGGAGQVLDVGRARRTFDGPVRTAVIVRDGGCVHPGCDRPARWCDVHHVIPWWAGGDTSLANGVLLCGFHHTLYDNGTWHLSFAADGIPEAVPPTWVDRAQRPIRNTRFKRRPDAA